MLVANNDQQAKGPLKKGDSLGNTPLILAEWVAEASGV